MAELTPYQRDILARTALGEARGQGEDGMADVVQVILNRAKSGRFPSDPAQVALQNKQFSTWNKGEGGNNPQQFKPSSKAYQTAAQVVDLVAAGLTPDMTGGALDYHASNISPYWADSKRTPYGTIQRNGHTFYAQHPVPPADVPSVASLLSVYREPPTPATISPPSAALRGVTSPTGGNTDLQSALQRYATQQANEVVPAVRRPTLPAMGTPDVGALYSGIYPQAERAPASSAQSLTDPGAIDAVVRASQGAPPNNTLQQALAARVAPPLPRQLPSSSDLARGRSPMPSLTVGGRAPIGLEAPGNLDLNARKVLNTSDGGYRTENSISIGTDQGEVLIPTVINGRQLSEPAAIAHYEQTGENLGTFKTPQAADRYAETLHERQGQRYGGAALPTPPRASAPAPSPIGQPPATRSVQSVPMPPLRQSVPQSYAGQDRYIAPAVSTAAAAVSASDRARAARAAPAPYIPGPPAVAKDETRLLPSSPFPLALNGYADTAPVRPPVPAVRPAVPQNAFAAIPAALAPPPVPAPPYRAVGDALSVNAGIAPPYTIGRTPLPAPLAQTNRAAPTPMPRLDRGGIFGKPQLFGHDIPIPGAFGLLQNATRAMNNASGPFNNGGDNLLYNIMRGGDFNTPGAATATAGGYLYAPKQGGGWLNVGRANPAQSPAAVYASRTTKNSDDAADRVNGSGSGGGGPRSFVDY